MIVENLLKNTPTGAPERHADLVNTWALALVNTRALAPVKSNLQTQGSGQRHHESFKPQLWFLFLVIFALYAISAFNGLSPCTTANEKTNVQLHQNCVANTFQAFLTYGGLSLQSIL